MCIAHGGLIDALVADIDALVLNSLGRMLYLVVTSWKHSWRTLLFYCLFTNCNPLSS